MREWPFALVGSPISRRHVSQPSSIALESFGELLLGELVFETPGDFGDVAADPGPSGAEVVGESG